MSSEVLTSVFAVAWCLTSFVVLGFYLKERARRKLAEDKLDIEQEINQQILLERKSILEELERVREDKIWLKHAN